jgi:hypothetical protein
MFDKYLIDGASVRNVGPADAPTGFAFEAKLGYYRGLVLSMIEELAVTLDGTELPREAVLFDEGLGPISLDAMETAYDRRWAFGTPATIIVNHPGGLPAGNTSWRCGRSCGYPTCPSPPSTPTKRPSRQHDSARAGADQPPRRARHGVESRHGSHR